MPLSSKTQIGLILTATAAYFLLIFVGTHLPGNVTLPTDHWDKVYHFSAYLGLSILLCGSAACFRRMGPALYAAVVGVAACYGVVDELTQMLVKKRTADPLDWLADVCGAIVGTLIFALGMRLFRRPERAHGATG